MELKLSPREGYELVKDGALQRLGTPPRIGRKDTGGYSLFVNLLNLVLTEKCTLSEVR